MYIDFAKSTSQDKRNVAATTFDCPKGPKVTFICSGEEISDANHSVNYVM